MEEILTDLRATAALIDQAKDKTIDQSDSRDDDTRDLLLALSTQLDFAAQSIRLAIGIAHRRQNKRHWAVK